MSTLDAAAIEVALWRFAVKVYEKPGVREDCLYLQDQFAQDVPRLLFYLWAAKAQIALPAETVDRIDQICEAWRADVVAPLRAIRRRLKGGAAALQSAPTMDVEPFRGSVKRVELEAEKLQLAALAALAASLDAAPLDHAAPNWRDAARRYWAEPEAAEAQKVLTRLLDIAEDVETQVNPA